MSLIQADGAVVSIGSEEDGLIELLWLTSVTLELFCKPLVAVLVIKDALELVTEVIVPDGLVVEPVIGRLDVNTGIVKTVVTVVGT